MGVLTKEGGDARFVGGAVRNALLGAPVTDIDIATALEPDDVMRRLVAAGLGALPTGIEHGTVTAVADGVPFEVTTLRRDVATDGRRAVVAFTADWKEDASRRDFTMNALYADEAGTVFDYFGGIADLRAGKVRFVGEPLMRIREDYLRILRLFRFHAWYGRGEIDKAALAAAEAEKAGLKTLSGERVQKELLRLLEAKDPMPAVNTMVAAEILQQLIPRPRLDRLQNLVRIERERDYRPEPILRLAALLPSHLSDEDPLQDGLRVVRRLRLSNADSERAIAAITRSASNENFDKKSGRVGLYNMGSRGFRDVVMLRWASRPLEQDRWSDLESLSHSWTRPQFPIDGRDVKRLDIGEGPKVGALLRDLEQWWIDSDFGPDRETLLARLRDMIKKQKG
jgi:poly(A) polymerase